MRRARVSLSGAHAEPDRPDCFNEVTIADAHGPGPPSEIVRLPVGVPKVRADDRCQRLCEIVFRGDERQKFPGLLYLIRTIKGQCTV